MDLHASGTSSSITEREVYEFGECFSLALMKYKNCMAKNDKRWEYVQDKYQEKLDNVIAMEKALENQKKTEETFDMDEFLEYD